MERAEQESERRGLPLDHVVEDKSDLRQGLLAAGLGVLLLALGILAWTGGSAFGGLSSAGAGVALLAFGARRLWVRSHWQNPQLHLPSSGPLRLGDQVTARFRRHSRDPDGAIGANIAARLFCQERTVRGSGKHRQVSTSDIYEAELAVTPYLGPNRVEADIVIVVPVYEAPPSMDLGDNEIHWRLQVTLTVPDAPDDDATFPLIVAPEIAATALRPTR